MTIFLEQKANNLYKYVHFVQSVLSRWQVSLWISSWLEYYHIADEFWYESIDLKKFIFLIFASIIILIKNTPAGNDLYDAQMFRMSV